MSNSQSIYAYRRDRSKYRLNDHLDDIETLKNNVETLDNKFVFIEGERSDIPGESERGHLIRHEELSQYGIDDLSNYIVIGIMHHTSGGYWINDTCEHDDESNSTVHIKGLMLNHYISSEDVLDEYIYFIIANIGSFTEDVTYRIALMRID